MACTNHHLVLVHRYKKNRLKEKIGSTKKYHDMKQAQNQYIKALSKEERQARHV